MLQASQKDAKTPTEGEEPSVDVVVKIFDTLVLRNKIVRYRKPSPLTSQSFSWDSAPFHQVLEELFKMSQSGGQIRHSMALYIFVVAGTTVGAAERIFEMADENKDDKLNLRVWLTFKG